MPERAESRPLPAVEIVDMRAEFQQTGHEQVISSRLAGAMSRASLVPTWSTSSGRMPFAARAATAGRKTTSDGLRAFTSQDRTREPGGNKLKPIEDAPGRYVKVLS